MPAPGPNRGEAQKLNAGPLWCLLFVVLALAAHWRPFLRYEAGDVLLFVTPWYERVSTLGFQAFARPFSNYTPPYLYLLWLASFVGGALSPMYVIKLLAGVGALWLALALYRLFRALEFEPAAVAALGSLLLPSIILNVSVLGQADTFWVAPCVLAFTAALGKRFAWVAIWSGVAFAFKAQAIFFAPFVIWFFLTNRAPWWCWLGPPFVYAAAALPAWLAGWDWLYLVSIYFRQAAWQPEDKVFISDSASWWTLFGAVAPALSLRLFPLGYMTALGGTGAYVAQRPRQSPNALLIMAILSAAGLPFLLPGMHERFFLLAAIFAYVLALVSRSRSAILAAVLIEIASAVPTAGWAYDIPNILLVAPFVLVGALLILIEMLRAEGAQEPSNRQELAYGAAE